MEFCCSSESHWNQFHSYNLSICAASSTFSQHFVDLALRYPFNCEQILPGCKCHGLHRVVAALNQLLNIWGVNPVFLTLGETRTSSFWIGMGPKTSCCSCCSCTSSCDWCVISDSLTFPTAFYTKIFSLNISYCTVCLTLKQVFITCSLNALFCHSRIGLFM